MIIYSQQEIVNEYKDCVIRVNKNFLIVYELIEMI